jgi:2-dehydropantoate 2-reductase
MKIAMMGSGGVGGYFGARLAQGGADVTFIARGEHLAAMKKYGLKVDSAELGDALIHPVQATDNPSEVGPVDYIIIAIKLWGTEEIAEIIKPMVGLNTTVVSLQNGVESDDIIAGIIGRDHLIGGIAQIASSISAPGVIYHLGTMQRVVLGELGGGATDRVENLRAALEVGGVVAEASEDIQRTIWDKFVFLVGLSGTTTLVRRTIGPIREDPAMRRFLYDVMNETVQIARAKGIDFPADYADEKLAFVDGLPFDMTASMHHDLDRGNSLEVAWLSGAVARFGAALGIETPVNRTIDAALRPYAKYRD